MGNLRAQDSIPLTDKILSLPDKLFGTISKKTSHLEEQLTKNTARYLSKLEKQEKRIKRKIARTDSGKAAAIFGDIDAKYNKLRRDAANPAFRGDGSGIYSGHLDSLQTIIRFAGKQGFLPTSSSDMPGKYESLLNQMQTLQGSLNRTAAIRNILDQRRQYLKTQFENLGYTKMYRKFQQQVYYYKAQAEEYKRIFEEPDLLEKKLLSVANGIPAFRDFFNKNSWLASMFRLPGNDPSSLSTIPAGLQTRDMVMQNLQQRFGTGVDLQQRINQGVANAQNQLDQLKDKVMKAGENGGDVNMPDFKPNNQKVKSFWNRLQLGTDLQSQRSNGWLPVTSDIGFSLGYKLNSKSIVGIGASYKLGWGNDIQHISFSSQGAGLRSFLDWKLKGSFYISGGYELNYRSAFKKIEQLKDLNAWQQSGLTGISKLIPARSKLFKNTKLQLMFDFLSYRQVPRTQPLIFRIGYAFSKN